MGFLGNHAPYPADINLIAQMAAYSLLLAGAYLARASRLRAHNLFMKAAIVVQFGALIFWMGPSLFVNIGAFRVFGAGPFITALHVFGGLSAVALAITAARHRTLGTLQLRWTMRATFLAWTLTVILGLAFYAYYYLL